MSCYLGIDFGTSGARAIAMDAAETIQAQVHLSFRPSAAQNWAATWQQTLLSLLEALPLSVRQEVVAIAINGTSATVLLCDARGQPLTEPLLYSDGRGAAVKDDLAVAPSHHPAASTTSSLAKLLWWSRQPVYRQAVYFLHQADWLAYLLHGQLGISDYHNALKLGYDVRQLEYPHWLQNLPMFPLLPQVRPPGTPIAEVTRAVAQQLGLRSDCWVCTGTTDSIAAFLASGAQVPGEAVTSLGSTLVLKLLSHRYLEDSRYGIYSHRLGELWLTGGASNTGGAVLRHFFSDEALETLSQQIDPAQASPHDYYPLLEKGDRFPINDPQHPPRLTPRPAAPVQFLHGLLESLARIETQGYRLLQDLGATALTTVYTAGGGAKNQTWTQIRQRCLGVPVVVPHSTAAAYGTARLAKQAFSRPR
ncbi:MAG: FGGY-family carbohydrate kinase [Cyanophyceae cyanobacterium]